jgi:predicted Fe-Mo cluster-binding NifX family protein
MKVAVSAVQPSMDSAVDPRFGRCACFILIDTETMQWEVQENQDAAMASGAGVGAARLVARQGARAVITGVVGPNAAQTLRAASIEVFTVPGGTVRDAVEALRSGRLRPVRDSLPQTAPVSVGPGRPMGMGRGRGGGCGMGSGQGRGQGRGMGGGRNR